MATMSMLTQTAIKSRWDAHCSAIFLMSKYVLWKTNVSWDMCLRGGLKWRLLLVMNTFHLITSHDMQFIFEFEFYFAWASGFELLPHLTLPFHRLKIWYSYGSEHLHIDKFKSANFVFRRPARKSCWQFSQLIIVNWWKKFILFTWLS